MNTKTENNAGVYCIINKVNDKMYVGSSTNIKNRWREHKRALRNGCHVNPYLQKVWNKYGEESFEFKVIAYTDPDEAIVLEQYILDNYFHLFEYNIAKNATAPMLGRKMSKKAKVKISEANRRRIGENNPNFGKHHTEETRHKMSEASLGKKNPNWINIPEEKMNEMKSLRAQGYSYEKIAKIFGISEPTLWRRLNLEYRRQA